MLSRIWGYHTSTPARAAISLLSLAALLYSYAFTYQYFTSAAVLDLISWVPEFHLWADHKFTLQTLIQPHNEHRIATTRLVLLADSVAFSMNGRLPVIVNLLLLAGIGLVIWRFTRSNGLAGSLADLPPLFWVAFMSSTCQAANLILPFQVQFSITCLCICGAASLLAAAAQPGRARVGRRGVAAGVLAIIAMFSMGIGVFMAFALCAMLPLSRAPARLWWIYLSACALGAIMAVPGMVGTSEPTGYHVPIFSWAWTLVRLAYACNFLASAFNLFAGYAIALGALLSLALAVAIGFLARKRIGHTGASAVAVPVSDAALVSIALGVFLCGPAGAFSGRLMAGPSAALVSRYATMSLLLMAALGGLYLRWGSRQEAGNRIPGFVHPLLAAILLTVLNLPGFRDYAHTVNAIVRYEVQYLTNNIEVQGPNIYLYNDYTQLKPSIAFLHAHHLNMFSAENGLPQNVMALLREVGERPLPACQGRVEKAHRVDATGFLLTGWVADPDGQQTAPWIGAFLPDGRLVGTARSLAPRGDVKAQLSGAGEAFGFDTGFRLPDQPDGVPTASGAITVQILGVFSGPEPRFCRLPAGASLSALRISPLRVAEDLEALPLASAPHSSGFTSHGTDILQHNLPLPGRVDAWLLTPGAGRATLHFDLASASLRDSLLPFAVDKPQDLVVSVTFSFADGATIEESLPPILHQPGGQFVQIGAATARRHGGVTSVDVRASGDSWLAIGAPVRASVPEEWSRLY